MIDSNVLITITGLLASIYAINAINDKGDCLKENYTPAWGLQKALKVDREVAPNRQAAREGHFTSIQNNYQSMLNPPENASGAPNRNAFYTVPGTFQAKLAPRMFSGDYGANITYNVPSTENLAVPPTPIDFANAATSNGQIKENYAASCGKGGDSLNYHGGAPLMPPAFADGNYNKTLNDVYNGKKNLKYSHANLPVGDMTTVNSIGEVDQPVVYDRYMFANLGSNLRSQGDFIRGDLPVVPNNNGWFNVSVRPNIDLQQGALNVMGGINNETTQQLADLIYTTSGNYKTAIAGVSMDDELGNPATTNYSNRRTNTYRRNSQNPLSNTRMTSQYNTNLSAGGGDVNVVAFP